jgi:hypothetical protein
MWLRNMRAKFCFFEKLILLFFLTLIVQRLFSQNNYLEGQIITMNGDTVSGYINYLNWEKNPSQINFKKFLSENPSIYSPAEIKGFAVAGEKYERQPVQKEISPDNINDLTYDKSLKIIVDTVFLQTIIMGEKSLFCYVDKTGKENLYIKNDSVYELLISKKYLMEQYEMIVVGENKRYVNQLYTYLNDCQNISSKLRDVEYNVKSLKKLFDFYYSCSQSKAVFNKTEESGSFEYGILTGMSLTSLKFKSSLFEYLENAEFNRSLNLTIGLFFNYNLPRSLKKWSSVNEIMFTSYEINGEKNKFTSEVDYKELDVILGYSYLKMNNLVRFKYPLKRLNVFLDAGISNGYAIKEINHAKQFTKFYDTESTIEANAVKDSRKYEQGLIFGFGLSIKDFSFELRNERGNGMSNNVGLRSSSNRYFLILSYLF